MNKFPKKKTCCFTCNYRFKCITKILKLKRQLAIAKYFAKSKNLAALFILINLKRKSYEKELTNHVYYFKPLERFAQVCNLDLSVVFKCTRSVSRQNQLNYHKIK